MKAYVEKVSKLTKTQYIFPYNLKGRIGLSKNFILNKKNADSFLSYILSENGYTRIKENAKTYRIIVAKNVRYNPLKLVKASKENKPKLNDNFDYFMMEYKLSNTGIASSIARSLRPFMSRYGRIIAAEHADKIIVQDTAKNLHRLYRLIKGFDLAPSDDLKSKRDKNAKFERQLRLEKAKNCNSEKKS